MIRTLTRTALASLVVGALALGVLSAARADRISVLIVVALAVGAVAAIGAGWGRTGR